MSKQESITCDNCQKELITESSYPAKYSLELKAINTNINNTGASYAVCVHPPIDGVKHFCGKQCLVDWLNA